MPENTPNNPTPVAPSTEKKGGSLPLIVTILLVLVFIIGGAYFYFANNKTQTTTSKAISATVGIYGPLSGTNADYGIELRNGAILAIRDINAAGKLKLDWVERDEKSDNDLAKKYAQELADDKSVLGVVGPITSGSLLAAGSIFQDNGLPILSPSATNPKISALGDNIFRVVPTDALQGKQLAEIAYTELGLKRAAFLVDIDENSKDYSQGLADVISEEFKKLGGTVAINATYKKGDKDFTSQVATIKADGKIDVIFIPGYSDESALVSQQLQKESLKIQVIGGDGVGEGITNGKVIQLGGKTVEGLIATTVFDPNNPDAKVQRFIKIYKDNFGKSPSWVAVLSYDAMQTLATAIEQSGGASRAAVKAALAKKQNFTGLGRTITFDENGDVISPFLKLVIKNGSYEISK